MLSISTHKGSTKNVARSAVAAIAIVALIPIALACASDYDEWLYRVPITLGSSAASLVDYEVPVCFNAALLIANGKMSPDCSDVRFSDGDGNGLEYWIEDGARGLVWVDVPLIPSGGTTIYLHCGNPAATCESDGEATFDFFDDFEGDELDLTKWAYRSGSCEITVEDGWAIFPQWSGLASIHGVGESITIANARIKARFDFIRGCSDGGTGCWRVYAVTDELDYRVYTDWRAGRAHNAWIKYSHEGVWCGEGQGKTLIPPRTPGHYTWEVICGYDFVTIVLDGDLSGEATNDRFGSVGDEPSNVELLIYRGEAHVDWVFGCSYASEEPTVMIGAEEMVVSIDVKPGSFPNSINVESHGTIPVAILSTDGFDAPGSIDPASLTFGRTGEEPSLAYRGKKDPRPQVGYEDVNGDGRLDVVAHFHAADSGFWADDEAAHLRGKTYDGGDFAGSDAVRIVPPRRPTALETEPMEVGSALSVIVFPNPVCDVHTAHFSLVGPRAAQVSGLRIEIFDLAGRLVWEGRCAGHELDWHTENLNGSYLANGMYIYVAFANVGSDWVRVSKRTMAVSR